MSESVPSSVTGFAHRRPRADSVTSFVYFQEDDEAPEYPSDEAIEDGSDQESEGSASPAEDLQSNAPSSSRRKSSGYSRVSVDDPLLYRHDSTRTDASISGRTGRRNQKIYVSTEDLTIVVAGFVTRPLGLAVYTTLCILSLGIAYFLFRWLPRWRVSLIGSPTSLQDCAWVIIEVRAMPTCNIGFRFQLKGVRINGENLQFKMSPTQSTDTVSLLFSELPRSEALSTMMKMRTLY